MFNRLSMICLVLSAVCLAGATCKSAVEPPDDAIESPTRLRSEIDSRLEAFDTARFKEIVLDYFGTKERVKVRQLILVKRPSKVRVQTRLPGSNELVSLLVSDADRFALHQRRDNKFFTGPPTRHNINRLLEVDLSARDVVRVMLGGAPWDRFEREPGEPEVSWNTDTGRYDYRVRTDDGGHLTMQVRPTDFAVASVTERGPDGQLVYRYRTDDWSSFDGVTLPTYRRFEWPGRDLDFSLDVDETQVNVDLPDRLFELEPPRGSEIIEVDGRPTDEQFGPRRDRRPAQ